MVENTTYLEDEERKKKKRKRKKNTRHRRMVFIRKIPNKSSHVKPNLNSCYGESGGLET